MALKSKPLEVGDLVELRSTQKSLRKFWNIRNKVGIVISLRIGETGKAKGELIALVHWQDIKNGKTQIKLMAKRLKRVR